MVHLCWKWVIDNITEHAREIIRAWSYLKIPVDIRKIKITTDVKGSWASFSICQNVLKRQQIFTICRRGTIKSTSNKLVAPTPVDFHNHKLAIGLKVSPTSRRTSFFIAIRTPPPLLSSPLSRYHYQSCYYVYKNGARECAHEYCPNLKRQPWQELKIVCKYCKIRISKIAICPIEFCSYNFKMRLWK